MLSEPDDAGMFVCDCPTCGRRELRGPRSLHPVSTPAGVRWTASCRGCGAVVDVLAGRPAPAAPAPEQPVAA